jgi:tetratricopeptide (TPR) repeat protein
LWYPVRTMVSDLRSLLEQGYQARREHRLGEAKAIYQQAADLCEDRHDQINLPRAITRLGGIERDLGDLGASLQQYQQAVSLYRALNEPLALAHTIRHVGDILRESGQPAPALPCYEEALHIYRNHPETDTLDLANTLRGYALLNSDLGQISEAIESWREAGALYDQAWQEPNSPWKQSDMVPGINESQRQIALLSA